jgi:hypothetical protein
MSSAMPTWDHLWLDYEEGLFPYSNGSCHKHEEDSIRPGACWSVDLSFKDDELLP